MDDKAPVNYNIIFDLAHVLFTPDHTNFEFDGPSFSPIEHGIKLVQQCATQKHSTGKRLHRLFVLSNLDTESLDQLIETFPEIFAHFEGIVISGAVQLKKPDPRIFMHLLKTYELVSSDCIFIDDRLENIIAAQSVGIFGIVCDNYAKVEKELQILKVF